MHINPMRTDAEDQESEESTSGDGELEWKGSVPVEKGIELEMPYKITGGV